MKWTDYQTNQRYDKEENKFVIDVPLPGLKKEDITLKVVGVELHLSSKENDFSYATHNAWKLPDGVMAENVSGKLENGVMTVEVAMPKQYEKEIDIK